VLRALEEPVCPRLNALGQHGMGTDEALRVIQDDLGAVEVEGDAEHVGPMPGNQRPQADDASRPTLPVASRDRDPREPVPEAAVYALAGLSEGVDLPVAELNPEALGEGQEGKLLFHTPDGTWEPELGVLR